MTLNDCPRCWEANLRDKDERIASKRRRSSFSEEPSVSRPRRVPSPEFVPDEQELESPQDEPAAAAVVPDNSGSIQDRLRYQTSAYDESRANAMMALDSVLTYAAGLTAEDRDRLSRGFIERMENLPQAQYFFFCKYIFPVQSFFVVFFIIITQKCKFYQGKNH